MSGGLSTIHISLQSVPSLLNTEELVRIGMLLKDFCRRKGISRPRIALAALNPHAGEHGAFGNEDESIILPAVERLNELCPAALIEGTSVPACENREAAERIANQVLVNKRSRYVAGLAPSLVLGLIPL